MPTFGELEEAAPQKILICEKCERPVNIYGGAKVCCSVTAKFKWAYWIDGEMVPVEDLEGEA